MPARRNAPGNILAGTVSAEQIEQHNLMTIADRRRRTIQWIAIQWIAKAERRVVHSMGLFSPATMTAVVSSLDRREFDFAEHARTLGFVLDPVRRTGDVVQHLHHKLVVRHIHDCRAEYRV
jgi:hypothetical protein